MREDNLSLLKMLVLILSLVLLVIIMCSYAGKGLALLIGPIPGLNCEVVFRIVNEDSETRKTITVEECEKVP